MAPAPGCECTSTEPRWAQRSGGRSRGRGRSRHRVACGRRRGARSDRRSTPGARARSLAPRRRRRARPNHPAPCVSRTDEPGGATRTALSSRFASARLSTSRSPETASSGSAAASSPTPRGSRGRRELLACVLEQRRERDRLAAVRRRVEAGEREQVVGQPRHPVDRPPDHRDRPRAALGVPLGVRQRELEVGLDRRERRP